MNMPKVASRISVYKTISDEDQAILIQIRDNIRNNYFMIGDIANKYIYQCVRNDNMVYSQDIYDDIGKIVGKSGRTVRYYAEEATFYSFDVRDQYDILPFSFFVFARTMGDIWQEVLDYAMEHPHYSLDAIKKHYLPNFNSDGTIDDNGEEVGLLVGNTVDQDKAANIGPLINTMINLSALAIRLVNSAVLPISDEHKIKLSDAAVTIHNIILSIATDEN